MSDFRWRWMAADSFSWVIAALLAAEVRFEFAASPTILRNYFVVGLAAALLQIVIGTSVGVYRGRFRTGTFDEFRATCMLVGTITICLTVFLWIARPVDYPRSMMFGSAFFALAAMLGARSLMRSTRQRLRGRYLGEAQRVILFGAGEAGEQLARAIRRNPHSQWHAVAFLDDAPQRRNLQLEGIRVRGTREDIACVAQQYGAKTLIVSIARVDAELLSDLAQRCAEADVHMLVLPPVSDLITSQVNLADVREVNEADLLGRTVVDTDGDAIASMLHGKRILITGAGGSIGSEIARRVYPFGPERLFLLDRDESALHAVYLSIHGNALLESDDLVLADVRDSERINEVFNTCRPDIVFHAAALKHLPLLEHAPQEAVKTNVLGTLNVLEAAKAAKVEAFINISTDKAANPVSVLGFSKRITERLTANADSSCDGRYLSVRFGNVLGSRGSMLLTFTGQIERGGPVTITHPEVTRYFMTIPEAVQLVLQASTVGRGGEVLILDMGHPVRIAEVARRLIQHSGKRVDIIYTGLRAGEKLEEDLVAYDESPTRPFHPKIMHVDVPALDAQELSIPSGGVEATRIWFAQTADETALLTETTSTPAS